MKKGDVVTIDDSSYSFTVMSDGRLEHHAGEVQKERWVIVAAECVLPAEWDRYCSAQHNDTIVQGQTSGKIAFVQQRFCRLPKPTHSVMVDIVLHPGYGMGGQMAEISDELYKQIKK